MQLIANVSLDVQPITHQLKLHSNSVWFEIYSSGKPWNTTYFESILKFISNTSVWCNFLKLLALEYNIAIYSQLTCQTQAVFFISTEDKKIFEELRFI